MTITLNPINESLNWIPTKECANWCTNQKISIDYNIEVTSVLLVSVSLILLVIAEWLQGTKYEKYSYFLMSLAMYPLYMFFFMYFIVMKMGLYHYGI